MLGQRGSRGGHDIRDVRLRRRDRVEVALHQDGMLQLVDRLARPVQVEQGASLVVERRLRRIQILGLVAVVDHPAAEGNQLAALVVDRDDDPLPESVP